MNQPIVANDPTGHYCVGDVEECIGNDEKHGVPTSPIEPPCLGCDVQGDSGANNGYNGPLPDDMVNTLVSQGADPEMLDNVVIVSNPSDINWQFRCSGPLNKNVIARTYFNNIYWCMPEYFDSHNPTPVLLHELVHVAQYGKYPDDVNKEQLGILGFAVWDIIGSLFDKNWEKYNPYKSSWVEVQGANCQVTFTKNPSIPLDRPPCNIWITLP